MLDLNGDGFFNDCLLDVPVMKRSDGRKCKNAHPFKAVALDLNEKESEKKTRAPELVYIQ